MKRKIKKRVKNQSGFFKHAIIYVILLSAFLLMATIIHEEEFFVGLGIPMFFWGIGLTIHFASAFLFNRINSWKETKYQEELNRLHLSDSEENEPSFYEELADEDWEEPQIELKDLRDLKEPLKGEKWGEGDFV